MASSAARAPSTPLRRLQIGRRWSNPGGLERWLEAERDPLPPSLRVNLATADVPNGLTPGARIRLLARLMPPPEPSVPGAYDYARVAWFDRIGATGRGFAPVEIVTAGPPESPLRQR